MRAGPAGRSQRLYSIATTPAATASTAPPDTKSEEAPLEGVELEAEREAEAEGVEDEPELERELALAPAPVAEALLLEEVVEAEAAPVDWVRKG